MRSKLIREKIVRFFRVGYLLHIMIACEISVLLIIYTYYLKFPIPGTSSFNITEIIVALYLTSFPLFALLDARSRYQNYKKIRDQFYRYGFRERILTPVLKSRCQRDAALVAASDLGYERQCMQYFHSMGYRWYHLFPDFMTRSPKFLFYPEFWTTTFFVPVHRSDTDHLLLQKRFERNMITPVP